MGGKAGGDKAGEGVEVAELGMIGSCNEEGCFLSEG